ncbi:MAG: response regulator [Chloroflexi bacterium]|nr:response regulator [Chloroflexota bacterium]
MSSSIRILYVDDSSLDRELVCDTLEKENGGFEVVVAASRADFETALANGEFDLILSDFNILGFEGLQVLEAVHLKDANLPVVIVTGTGSEEIAVEAMKRGAADYVIKTPSHIQRLPQTIHAALERKHLQEERRRAEERIRRQVNYLTALQDIDRTIASAFGAQLSLKALISKATSLLAVDAAAVVLVNFSTNTLQYTATEGFRTDLSKAANIKSKDGYASRVALEQRIVKIPNPMNNPDNDFLTEFFKEDGFVNYHGAPLIIKGKVIGVLEVFHRSYSKRDQEWLDFLNALAGQAAIAIHNAELFDRLQHSNDELIQAYNATIEGWSRAMDLRDRETEGHTQRVTDMALRLAALMGFDDKEQLHIRRGALLHDIGKLGVPDSILLKPGTLTDEERAIIRKHPAYAYEMLSSVEYLKPALDIPYCHHEKWDGTGYPRGLKGEEIPLTARIFTIVDVWDALRSDRPYRESWSREKVLDYIRAESGKQFDPQVVESFLLLDL